ncbi:PopZ family protein [Phyllobacterium lublinensis]|uniref:PopZ family protein n=1 Tax=Phyllobacterium lublinensis TaxID=2875708 RepID=UPI001CCBBA1C|nr:DUF2497 domain-containing protein [Phyllobacterium sp. 2063]MBZ9653586.1 DUF2497 domain-containing protein [Phyllobacterium sp. 2063]
MAQSSTVAREPSMEEILASIRRIIEESDTGGRTDDALPQPVNSDVPARTAELESRRVEQAGEEQLPPREGIAVSQPISHPYEAALGRTAASPQQRPIEQGAIAVIEPLAESPQPKAAPLAATQATPRPDFEEDALEAYLASAESVLKPAAPVEQTFIAEPAQPEIEVEAVATTVMPPVVEHENEARAAEEPLDFERALEPILSEAAERQVSSAFEDLSFAVRNEQRRSFDEIAQDLMRPLLQEWLDNNLPTLVERLVREEIERVARGGRR